MKVFIATKNAKKLKELERILIPMGFDVFSERDLNEKFDDVPETGTTFEENALIKARAGLKNTGCISVADDSGICVDFLDGAPGVFSARYAGEPCDDERNLQKLIDALEGVPDEKRGAMYVSAIACVFPDGREFTVRGECKGVLATKRLGNGGFGYDPIFVHEIGCFGIVSAEQKDSVSHRGQSLKLFKEELKKYL